MEQINIQIRTPFIKLEQLMKRADWQRASYRTVMSK